MPLELLQDSDSSSVTIGPHWPSSYPEYLSPYQDKDEQQRIVWARLRSQRSNLAKSLKEQKEQYQALCHELNPRTTQVESSHDPLYRDTFVFEGSKDVVHHVLERCGGVAETKVHDHWLIQTILGLERRLMLDRKSVV